MAKVTRNEKKTVTVEGYNVDFTPSEFTFLVGLLGRCAGSEMIYKLYKQMYSQLGNDDHTKYNKLYNLWSDQTFYTDADAKQLEDLEIC